MSSVVRDVLFWGAVATCAIAQVFIVRAALVGPAPAPEGSPAAEGRAAGRLRAPSRPLEVFWAVVPGVALAALAVWAWEYRA
jgi:hypothetical protein